MPAIAPNAPHTALAGQGVPQGNGWAAQWPRLPGLLVALGIAAIAIAMGQWHWLADHGLSPLVLAIALGIAAGNTVYPRWATACDAGVGHARQTWLRAGIVLYGLRLTLQDIVHLGWAGLAVDALVLSSTFVLAVWLGTRWLGLERSTAVLIGAGSSICGAAAVLATAPVARARNDQVAVAVATVVVFGTLAVFVYPTLAAALQPAVGDPRFAGLYMGSTIHEVAQVVAAGRSLGESTADLAIVAKLVRVLMLAPFLVALSWWLGRDTSDREGRSGHAGRRPAIAVPWFAVAFMAVVALHSLFPLPAVVSQAAVTLDTVLLATAMAALGLGTHHTAIRRAGIKPLILASVLFAWLLGGGAVINAVALRLG
ncbi:YeiH family protein [Comamonadaceae bacterium PP-2]